MLYRKLTNAEITQLEHNGCNAENWDLVRAKEGFDSAQVKHVNFSGEVQLGFFKPGTGIRNAQIQNCTIEDNVCINQVGLISNYIVRSHARIEFCGTIKADDKSRFGNGTIVEPVNEGGGRHVTLFNGLSAQIAYLMVFMRHRPLFVENLEVLVGAEVVHSLPEKGVIGHHAQITSSTTLTNICIGDNAVVEGALHLNNGTILSSSVAPTVVGHGVAASDFIVSFGSRIDNGSILKKCFVGEGCVMDRGFSAENSLFFANSQLYHGEACSVFAAPYTVSHHKSTLLIAAYCGFINVGSGSNQSNHMYKLGPVHQGIMERGCKLGSDSYILWPAKIGSFTFVTGRHYGNPDIADFPFSYLLDEEGTSQLVPAANLRSVGTLRDAAKWPQRDIRKGPKSDLIHFELFNPFTMQAALRGKKALLQLEQSQKAESGYYLYGGVKIKRPSLKRGIEVYNEALTIYVGNLLIDKILVSGGKPKLQCTAEQRNVLGWVDLAGMLINEADLAKVIEGVEQRSLTSLSKLNKELDEVFRRFDTLQWNWMLSNSMEMTGHDLTVATESEVTEFINKWLAAVVSFYQMLLKDAQKEFSERSKIGFGYNTDANTRRDDFAEVRKTFDSNPFVMEIQAKILSAKQMAEEAISSYRRP